MPNNILENINILVNDPNYAIAQVVTQNMRAAGFRNVNYTRYTRDASEFLQNNQVDLLITEWAGDADLYGIDLVKKIRRAPQGAVNPLMPIFMFTGHNDLSNVTAARDAGINEFVTKPFSTGTLLTRIQQLIEKPRGFVVSKEFVGPDRRRARKAEGGKDRRGARPRICLPNEINKINSTGIILPQHVIRHNLGINLPLSDLITQSMLEDAESTIRTASDSAVQWLREDLLKLEHALNQIHSNNISEKLENDMRQAAVSIRSRAGKFNLTLASEIARQLCMFLARGFRAYKTSYHPAIQNHVNALKIAINHRLATTDPLASDVLAELRHLTSRLA